jgi:phosphoglycerate dehydrogenase-like enzyme
MNRKLLISFHIDYTLIQKIQQIDPNIEILYDPNLLGKPRYKNDQHGGPIKRTNEQEKKYQEMMAQAEILFGYIPSEYRDLKKWFPKLRWNQSPSAGIGWALHKYGWTETDIDFTTASGMHATPLAEFCIMSMLMFVKNYFLMAKQKQKRHWQRTSAQELRGKTMGVIGLGRVGQEVARLGQCFGMNVIGTKRTIDGVNHESVNVDELYAWNDLEPVLSISDFLVLICPETNDTRGMMGKEEFNKMKKGAVLINIARGSIVNEPDLIKALQMGHLGGAALDVAAKEPLPPESPLWDMNNVIISPHSASTVEAENEKLTEIFVNNLQRYIEGRPFRNLLDKKILY